MNLCRDCIFFNSGKRAFGKKSDGKFGICYSGKIIYDHGRDDIEDTLFYCDSEEYSAAHEVGHLFGCVHFKEKGEDANESSTKGSI